MDFSVNKYTYGAQYCIYIPLIILNLLGIKLFIVSFKGGLVDWLGHVKIGPKLCFFLGVCFQIPLYLTIYFDLSRLE